MELINVGGRFDIFRKEPALLLEAVDLNSKNFSFVLAQVLLKPRSIIYIDTQCLTKKGGDRLYVLLQDLKSLFDDRLWIILFSQTL